MNKSIYQSTCQSTYESIIHPINQSINQSILLLTKALAHWLGAQVIFTPVVLGTDFPLQASLFSLSTKTSLTMPSELIPGFLRHTYERILPHCVAWLRYLGASHVRDAAVVVNMNAWHFPIAVIFEAEVRFLERRYVRSTVVWRQCNAFVPTVCVPIGDFRVTDVFDCKVLRPLWQT